ncbi:DUF4870 domain-containing protein [Promicromonospora iranensis]|uniref:Tic20 family protein n=1 Tax=Promicromonospora iranensis TaxID=1105144 RepID=A0ABU2CTD0_9MICO|nr:DUF4870 domain-containing protein [Promicromonospora iranensis]MDR7384605.1 putative Tic20 family protein [Promicromonospora iranensis]
MSENPQQPQSPQQPGPPPQQPEQAPAYGSPPPGQPPHQDQPGQAGQPQPGTGYGPPYGPGAPYQPQPLNPSDERMWTVFAQIGPVLLSFIAPLVIWLVFRDRSRFVDQEGKEALNFQITLIFVHIACAIISVVTFGLGSIVYVVFIAAVVFMILAAVENSKGAPYRYPLNIRLIK